LLAVTLGDKTEVDTSRGSCPEEPHVNCMPLRKLNLGHFQDEHFAVFLYVNKNRFV
jgi:hypothetical protein